MSALNGIKFLVIVGSRFSHRDLLIIQGRMGNTKQRRNNRRSVNVALKRRGIALTKAREIARRKTMVREPEHELNGDFTCTDGACECQTDKFYHLGEENNKMR